MSWARRAATQSGGESEVASAWASVQSDVRVTSSVVFFSVSSYFVSLSGVFFRISSLHLAPKVIPTWRGFRCERCRHHCVHKGKLCEQRVATGCGQPQRDAKVRVRVQLEGGAHRSTQQCHLPAPRYERPLNNLVCSTAQPGACACTMLDVR